MKIYIASKYIEHSEINRKIEQILLDNGFDVFLPESINMDGKTMEEMTQIAYECYTEIDSCDILLVVSPTGRSVSAEIGYAIYRKIKFTNISIIQFRYKDTDRKKEDKESMIIPYYDYIIDSTANNDMDESLKELVTTLTLLKNK